jgi:methyl-accepting chemotaxis protein
MKLRRLLPYTIKNKFNFILYGIFSLLLGTIIISIFLQQKELIFNTARNQLEMQLRQVQNIIKGKSNTALNMARLISADNNVQKMVAEGNRKGLSDLFSNDFQKNKNKSGMVQFHFHTPPAISLFRVHKPEKSGDDLSSFRFGVVDVNKYHREVSGIEKGVTGFGMRGIVPIKYMGQHVGSVEFGAKLNNDFAKSIKNNNGHELSIVVPDKNGFRYQAKSHKLTIPAKSYPFLRKMLKSKDIFYKQVSKNNKNLLTIFAPLKDYSGKNIGIIAIPKDITPLTQKLNRQMQLFIITGIILLALCIMSVTFFFNRMIHKPLKNIIEKLQNAGNGDLTQEITNIQAINCSDITKCNHEECSCFGKKTRCWETAGSFSANIECPKILSGKYKLCTECTDVYQAARVDEIQELSSYFNSFIYSMRLLIGNIAKSTEETTKANKAVLENSQQINTGAEELQSQSDDVEKLSGDITTNMQTVSDTANEMSTDTGEVSKDISEMSGDIYIATAAIEKMSVSIQEVAENCAIATKQTEQSSQASTESGRKIKLLVKSAEDINKIIDIITEISEQTKLLCLECHNRGSQSRGSWQGVCCGCQ